MAKRIPVQKNLNILLLGETGSGKSHLIKVLFGDNAEIVSGFKWGTQELTLIRSAMEVRGTEYQITFADTKGMYDPLNPNLKNVEETLNDLKKKLPTLHYVFVCLKFDRFKQATSAALEHLFGTLVFPKNRIIVFITGCDGFSPQAFDTIKGLLSGTQLDKILSTYTKNEVYFIGSFNNDLIDEDLKRLNPKYEQRTADIVGEIFQNELSNNAVPFNISSGCSMM